MLDWVILYNLYPVVRILPFSLSLLPVYLLGWAGLSRMVQGWAELDWAGLVQAGLVIDWPMVSGAL